MMPRGCSWVYDNATGCMTCNSTSKLYLGILRGKPFVASVAHHSQYLSQASSCLLPKGRPNSNCRCADIMTATSSVFEGAEVLARQVTGMSDVNSERDFLERLREGYIAVEPSFPSFFAL